MAPPKTANGRKPLSAAKLRMSAEDWAYAVASLGSEEAQRRGWIGGDWRNAWWMRGDALATWRALYGDETGMLVQWRSKEAGAVWLCRSPEGNALRWYAASSWPGGPECTDRAAVLALAAERGETWLWWFHVYDTFKPRKDHTMAVLGAPAVVTWGENGEATMGPITRTAKGLVLAVLGPDGEDVEVRVPSRSWAFNSRWREAAMAMIAQGRVQHRSAMSAQYHVLHQRNRMVRAGELPVWEGE